MALGSIALVGLGAIACKDILVAENLSSPDVERVFATPGAIEQTIGSGYQSCHNNVTNSATMTEVSVMGLESYSQLNNNNMGPRSTIPRNPIQNQLGSSSIFGEFSSLTRAARLAVNAVNALDRLRADDPSPADGILGSEGRDLRARAFGFFVIGCNQGWLSIIYDSAAVMKVGLSSDTIPPLTAARFVMDTAIQHLDSAIAIANRAEAAAGFPTINTWLGGRAHSRDEFVRLVRTYRARFRAGIARTAAERDAVDWPAVIDDAENGITSDFRVNVGAQTGWNSGFFVTTMFQDGRNWSQISLMYYGMADVSGGYDAWLATPLMSRSPFLVVTPDRRWPSGATRAAQVSASVAPPANSYNHFPYVAALSPDDTGEPWGWSYYQFNRNRALRFNTPASSGDYPEIMKPEMDLLAAEGYIRTGNIAAAAAKIDISRVARGGLPALTGVVTTASDPVPGGASCVPRVPVGPNFTSTACGNIMEAMKWEKRMETAYTSFARWWIDGRGWGDLVEGTALEYPVPFQEMNARGGRPSYPLGGGGGNSAAPKGTYGF